MEGVVTAHVLTEHPRPAAEYSVNVSGPGMEERLAVGAEVSSLENGVLTIRREIEVTLVIPVAHAKSIGEWLLKQVEAWDRTAPRRENAPHDPSSA